jgi:hypothetical protein
MSPKIKIKKAIIIKEKLSKILKLLVNKQKFEFNNKKSSFKKRKINFLFFMLENLFWNIETNFLSNLKNGLVSQFKKLELKNIFLKNKTNIINENLIQLKSRNSLRINFIKKEKLFIEQNQAIKEKSYNIITENTRFKENKSNSSIDLYTIDGKKQSQTEPNFTITEAYFENNIGLKNIGDYLIGGMQKYGLKNIKTSNEIDTKTEYSVEVLGELDDKSKLFFFKVQRLNNKTIVIN